MDLKEFQQILKSQAIEAFLLAENNMYLNQDVKKSENNLFTLSGFSGSKGYMLVTSDNAWLFVDSRYSIQARLETKDKPIEVVDVNSFLPEIISMLKDKGIQYLTCNPWCISIFDWNLISKSGINVLANEILLENKISYCGDIFEHNIKYAGKTSKEKCLEVAKPLLKKLEALIVTSAESVSWLTNLRAKDLEHTPVLRAYALLSQDGQVKLFSDNCRYGNIKPLSELYEELRKYADKKIVIDDKITPRKILDFVSDTTEIVYMPDPISSLKLPKNQIELDGFKNAHIRDGVALVKFLYWFETNYAGKTEYDIVEKLKSFRMENELYFSDSFNTIAASSKNAAIVHYNPTPENCSVIKENSVLLLDSGAQYYDGTTDVTRTIAVGNPPDEVKDAFTQVLKAYIGLSSLVFPQNTCASSLDAVCRSFLWRDYKDYGHGTGHSVGHFSNVHETPFGLSPNNFRVVKENYITSIEPGYYKENEFGIRIENMVYVEKQQDSNFLKFKNLTFVPIDKRLINAYLLSSEERDWLNNYHKEVIDCLAPYLDKTLKEWLKNICSPL